MDILVLLLRLVHIVSGCLWVGFAVFVPFYLAPAVQDAGPDGGKVMAALQRRGILTVLPLLAVFTLLSGIWLFWRVSGGQIHAFMTSSVGMTLATGALSAMVAYVYGMTIVRPSMMKAMAAMQSVAGASTPEERESLMQTAARYRARGAIGGRVVAVLLILATAAMAVSRYVTF
jgi:hypothetical protein